MFEIEKILSFNKDALTQGQDYDYITRTSQNQGVLQTTGFVNAENLNPPFTWSLGLLQILHNAFKRLKTPFIKRIG
ncbi:hypothetical protein N410_01500 [Helicobacter pylori GC26]|uniref:restriction endonuclease subunit S n=1 Tax=Helicobacter pylori TaxID=210 RepID=UPI00038E1F1F|nr:hypothetical protein N410_01500 [Helicobacter pylori GC26]